MTKQKTTKRALLLSALSLLMCVSMLIGSTFAWFTDSVTSTGNIIKSGTLDVTMEWADGTKAVPADDSSEWTDASTGAIFSYDKWEPGYVSVRHIKIANEGTLALKYQLNIIANGEVSELADVIDVYYLDPADQIADRTALTADKKIGTLTEVLANISTTASGELKATEKHTITLALKMQESAGNEYQDLAIGSDFSIQLLATQLTAETDSFDDQYDKFADYDGEISNAISLAAALKNGGTYKVTSDIALDEYVSVPAGVTVALDLNGKTISATSGNVIRNNGNLTVANGTLQGTTTYTINNESATGSVTVENVKSVSGGFFNAGSMIVNNCEITNTASGKHALYNAGTLVVNGGTYSTTAGNAILMSGSGTIEVNDGSFTQIGSSYMIDGSVVTINGGTFTDDDGKWAIRGTHTITGGTFNFDPSAYVADGYKAVTLDGKYIVVPESTDVATDDASLDAAITAGATTVMLGSGNYIIPDSAAGKTLTIVGNGDTVVATQDDGSYEGCDYSLDGSTVTFENITINTDSSTYTGYARLNATYKNCTINGTYTLYGDSVFEDCTFNVSGDVYNIWTWGAPNAKFDGCTFNSDGKALLLYGTVNTNLTVNNCVFNDNGGLTDLKAAIEIGNDYGKSYTLTVNNTVVNGYEINDKGINTGSTLWANKNSMGTDNLNVVIDGVDVY